MSKPTKRARIGGRESDAACPEADRGPLGSIGAWAREPRVFLVKDDAEFGMAFEVGTRRYFGPTGLTCSEAALRYARHAQALVIAKRRAIHAGPA